MMTAKKQQEVFIYPGRDRRDDQLKVCQMIVDSLFRDTECYDGYTQDLKRPFGNSGGPEHDIVERLDIDGACPTCGSCDSENRALAYAKDLWVSAEAEFKKMRLEWR